jgi:hypothetical protein
MNGRKQEEQPQKIFWEPQKNTQPPNSTTGLFIIVLASCRCYSALGRLGCYLDHSFAALRAARLADAQERQ